MEKIAQLTDWMRDAESTVILTCAVMSTDSGTIFLFGKGLIKQLGAIV
ncbi:hypothetical protein [Viridibacillus arvi]